MYTPTCSPCPRAFLFYPRTAGRSMPGHITMTPRPLPLVPQVREMLVSQNDQVRFSIQDNICLCSWCLLLKSWRLRLRLIGWHRWLCFVESQPCLHMCNTTTFSATTTTVDPVKKSPVSLAYCTLPSKGCIGQQLPDGTNPPGTSRSYLDRTLLLCVGRGSPALQQNQAAKAKKKASLPHAQPGGQRKDLAIHPDAKLRISNAYIGRFLDVGDFIMA